MQLPELVAPRPQQDLRRCARRAVLPWAHRCAPCTTGRAAARAGRCCAERAGPARRKLAQRLAALRA
eukprot:8104981-Alexandrium_andersonii.AAC.1